LNHLDWVISPGRGDSFGDPSCATAAPSGRHATKAAQRAHNLIYLAAVLLAVGVVTLGIGLFQA
jgi:hypothetical protein